MSKIVQSLLGSAVLSDYVINKCTVYINRYIYDLTPQESESLGFCYEIEERCRVHVVQLSNSSHSSWQFLSWFSEEKDCLDSMKVHWQICLSFLTNVSIQVPESVVSQKSDMCSILRASQKNCGSSTYLIIERGTNLVANLHNSCSRKSLWTAKELTQAFEVRITYTMLSIWHYNRSGLRSLITLINWKHPVSARIRKELQLKPSPVKVSECLKPHLPTCTLATSTWILGDWPRSLENCLTSLKNLQIYHIWRLGVSSNDNCRRLIYMLVVHNDA